MSKKHFIAFANWIAANTLEGSKEQRTAVAMVWDVAKQFNTRFDEYRFMAWIDKQRKAA